MVRPTHLLVLALSAASALAQCPRWQHGLQLPGMLGGPFALLAHDDGTGTKLYAGGSIYTAGSKVVQNLARWDGLEWETFGGPGPNGYVWDFQEFDDGSGPALYVAGQFTQIGGMTANRIARWNGSTWSNLGTGMDGVIYALQVFDDGTGPALYATGSFFNAGGTGVSAIARWNGSTWSPLGTGLTWLNGQALAVFDDGAGPELYVSGWFHTAGGLSVHNIARWNGSAWSDVGGGAGLEIHTLCVHDDGSGPALYAGGGFTEIGGVAAARVARWRGGAWSALGAGFNERITSFTSFDDGAGPKLYASGRFTASGSTPVRRLARWDGTTWSQLGNGADFESHAFGAFDDGLGGGTALYTGTGAMGPGGSTGISRWTGSGLATLTAGNALFRTTGQISVAGLAVFDDGSGNGPELHASGLFDFAGGVAVAGLARWNGWRWRAFPVSPSNCGALAVYDDGAGPALFANGIFPVGPSTFTGIARWTGSNWSPLGSAGVSGSTGSVNALAGHDDGGGPAIFVAGDFYAAGGVATSHIARYRAGVWSSVGSSLNRPANALAVFDEGTGPALFVGGNFFVAGGQSANGIARWSNGSWSALGSGVQQSSMNGQVRALAVFDDGTGPGLFAAGSFNLAGGLPAANVARWRNGAWSALGAGVLNSAEALVVHDDGSGPALYVTGYVVSAGGSPANGIAKWNGTSWSTLSNGLAGSGSDLASFDGGLYVLGSLLTSGSAPVYQLALWKSSEPSDCNANGIDDACDLESGTSVDVDGDALPDECHPDHAAVLCAGDNSSTPCPCGNVGAYGQGCGNSLFPRGARLVALGSAQVSADTLTLVGSSMPNSAALYFQGTQRIHGPTGQGAALGDGLRCAGGAVVRLATKANSSNASQYPVGVDVPVSVRGGVPGSGGMRVYQVWYRNADPSFCTPSTFNFTNAIGIRWTP